MAEWNGASVHRREQSIASDSPSACGGDEECAILSLGFGGFLRMCSGFLKLRELPGGYRSRRALAFESG